VGSIHGPNEKGLSCLSPLFCSSFFANSVGNFVDALTREEFPHFSDFAPVPIIDAD